MLFFGNLSTGGISTDSENAAEHESKPPHNPPTDEEKQAIEEDIEPDKVSAFKGLGWLDRFLAVWIILAMLIGILLGNFVPQTGPALEKGKFVGVSVPIGMSSSPDLLNSLTCLL